MCGAFAAGTGRNQGEDSKSVSRHPLTGGTSVPEQMQLMERVVEHSNMQAALKRVRQNKGAPGIDGMSVDQLGAFLLQHICCESSQRRTRDGLDYAVCRAAVEAEG